MDHKNPLTPPMIKVIREKLGLSQEHAGNLLGGGPRAFQKYETGTISPAAATENLLRLLNTDPGRLFELTGQRPPQPTLPQGLAVSDADVSSLSPTQLQATMRALIDAEAEAARLGVHWTHTPDQTDAPDQGEDARVNWQGSVAQTEFFPGRTTIFQFKATSMSRQKCVRELLSETEVKQRIQSVIANDDGAYVLVVARSMTQSELDARLAGMQTVVRDKLGASAASRVHLYSATQVSSWINRHPAVALSVLELLARPTPLRTFAGWARRPEHVAIPFQDDARLDQVVGEFAARLSQPRSVLRLVGLSGVGKSRLAIQAFQSSQLQTLRSKLVFADLGESVDEDALLSALRRLNDQRMAALVVVENCPPEAHGRLASLIRASDDLSLLTLDHDPEDAPEKELFKLEPMASESVDRIVRTSAPAMSEAERQRILQYAAGNAQIARLLAEVSAQGDNLATATNLHLARSVALGRRRGDEAALLTAQYIALFGLVRIDDDQPAELDYLHSLGAPDPIAFRRHVRHLQKRGTAQRRCGLIMLMPRPVALNLAADLWETWGDRERDAVLLKNDNRSQLKSLLRQLARLDAFDPAVAAAKRMMRLDGPLAAPGTLRLEQTVTIISSLAELAPAAASDLLGHLFADDPDLRQVEDRARRELVHALEKLAFRAETFESAALLMLELALAENESWGNNASGKFGDFFPLLLADTEAGPAARLRVIDAAISTNDPARLQLVIKALKRAVSTHHFSRSLGSESQGAAPPMEPWWPKTYAEQDAYLAAFLDRFASLASRGDDIGQQARSELGHRVLDLLQVGLTTQVEKAVKSVAAAHSTLWIEALESLQRALAKKEKEPPPEIRSRIIALRDSLQPSDLAGKLRFAVTETPWGLLHDGEDDDGDSGSLSERLVRPARNLAKAVAANPQELFPHLPALTKRQQRQAFAFGDTLAREIADPQAMLVPILAVMAATPETEVDSSLLGGFVHGSKDRSAMLEEAALELCADNGQLSHLLPYLTAVVGVTPARLRRLSRLATETSINPLHFSQLSGGRALDHIPPEEVNAFLLTLINKGGVAYGVAIEILGMYVHGRDEMLDQMRDTLRAIFAQLDVKAIANGQMAGHLFESMSTWLLSRGASDADASAGALILAQAIQRHIEDDNFEALENVIVPLLRNFGAQVWPILGSIAIQESVAAFRLQGLLGEANSFDEAKRPPIMELPETLLLAWCNANPVAGPRFLMQSFPALDPDTARDERAWHPFVQRLIDQFGADKSVLSALHARMYTFGWTGSLTTYFAMYRKPLTALLTHKIDVVRLWAQTNLAEIEARIEDQQKRDDEQSAIWES